MKKALFIPWAFTLLETYFPLADELAQEGFEIHFLNQLSDPRYKAGNEKMTNRNRLEYYKELFGFSDEIKPIKHMENFHWVDVSDIGAVLHDAGSFKAGYIKEAIDFPVADYDLIIMRTEYDSWPIMNRWMKETKVVGVPVRMMNTGINKKSRTTGYYYYDWCYEAKKKFQKKEGQVLFFHDGGTRALFDVSQDSFPIARKKHLDYLDELTRIVVLENGKNLVVRLHPQHHEWAGPKIVQDLISEICETHKIEPGKITVNKDEFIGKALASAETVILSPGASSTMKALMFDCNIVMLNFPRNLVETSRPWYLRHFDKYLSPCYANSVEHLQNIFSENSFSDHKKSGLYEYLNEFFDGNSVKRAVEYIMENYHKPIWQLSLESLPQRLGKKVGVVRDFI
ncbi:MAG: hypothetical protein HOB88_17820 [Bacteroidetes bacterium]|jgi:hypothetical protein|nr:hypothetical protein [Bacteroidota bacterium]